jgi:hypothetical protein
MHRAGSNLLQVEEYLARVGVGTAPAPASGE